MKRIFFPLCLLFFTNSGYMSGKLVEHSIESIIAKNDLVLSVTVLSSAYAYVDEITKAINNQYGNSEVKFPFYIAVVNETLYGDKHGFCSDEDWLIKYDKIDYKKVKKAEENNFSINPGDTIAIFNYERISYSYIYNVDKLHKIFIYNNCTDLASEIKNGGNYLFVTEMLCSKKNSAFYGKIGYGLLEDTKEMRSRIIKILKNM